MPKIDKPPIIDNFVYSGDPYTLCFQIENIIELMGYTFQKIFLLQTEGFCLVNHPRKYHSHSSILNSQKTVEKAESVVVLYVRVGKKSVWPSWALGVV